MRVTRGLPAAGDEPTALTVGNFDGVHVGHQVMLARLKHAAAERKLATGFLTFEPHPREFFAPDQAPVRLTSLREKIELVAARGIDRFHVCRFNYAFAQTTPHDFIERILLRGFNLRWLLIGDDFRFGARRAGDVVMLREAARQFGFEVEALTSVTLGGERVSSTAVRTALQRGDLTRAARLLDRPYSISGRVVRGDSVGRRLGFPTANVQMKHNRPPLTGIFAVEVAVPAPHGAGMLRGAASLGVRPTLVQGGRPVLEVHVFDFDGNLYGEHVRVDFHYKLRDEEKYSDLATLTRQIALDVESAKAYFHRMDSEARKRAGHGDRQGR
jgi:riboflavin kinase/FMN adenylyltransferase